MMIEAEFNHEHVKLEGNKRPLFMTMLTYAYIMPLLNVVAQNLALGLNSQYRPTVGLVIIGICAVISSRRVSPGVECVPLTFFGLKNRVCRSLVGSTLFGLDVWNLIIYGCVHRSMHRFGVVRIYEKINLDGYIYIW
jgi:hypothetical protein